jgi:uncharacterized membrane protein
MPQPVGEVKSGEVPHPEVDDNILYVFAYLLTWLSGLLLFITVGQKNKRIRFHAIQAILLGIVVFVLAWIPLPFFWLIAVVVWLYGMYIGFIGYQGRDISMPVIGEYALKYSS